jgi:hypothetical protein
MLKKRIEIDTQGGCTEMDDRTLCDKGKEQRSDRMRISW